MTTIFMNLEKIKIYERYRLVLNLKIKIDLQRGDKYVALSDLSI